MPPGPSGCSGRTRRGARPFGLPEARVGVLDGRPSEGVDPSARGLGQPRPGEGAAMDANVTIDDAAIDELRTTFSGELVRPNDASYEEARRVHNGLVDRRPSLIARCRGTADAAAAVGFAPQRGAPLSIRGGGHNIAGRSVLDGGIVVDLSPMKGVSID